MWYTLTCRGARHRPIFPNEKGYASPCDTTDTWQSVESQGDAFFFSSALSERWFYQDGGFTGTPSGQRVGEEVAL